MVKTQRKPKSVGGNPGIVLTDRPFHLNMGSGWMEYAIDPVPKPRMTQRDKWAKRPAVVRYWDFCDQVNREKVRFESGMHVIFYLPMPRSWSIKRKQVMDLSPHIATPDLDNLIKALGDACWSQDSHIWDIRATKRWAYVGTIRIGPMRED